MLEVSQLESFHIIMKKIKNSTIWAIGALEVAVLIFCLVISILTLTGTITQDHAYNIQANGPFIGWFINNPVWFFIIIVLPIFIIFIADIIFLLFYLSQRESSLSDKERNLIQKQAREQAKAELMKEMQEKDNTKE